MFFTEVYTPMDTIASHTYRLPPADWKDADAWQFLGFIIHFHTQQCGCGARHSWTQTLRLFGHRNYIASRGHRYLPFDSSTGMPQNEPLSIVNLPDEHVVICHSCLGGYRAAGSDVIELRTARDQQNWINALLEDAAREREQRRKASAAKEAKPSVPAASVDDLMNL